MFYNKQKGTPSDTRSATPRAMYINHSPQQSFHQQQVNANFGIKTKEKKLYVLSDGLRVREVNGLCG